MANITLTENELRIFEAIIDSYISVMGKSKWDSLTPEDQHAVVTTIMRDIYRAIDKVAPL